MLKRPPTGLLDTSVVLDLELLDPGLLPLRLAISAVTLAELSAGPLSVNDPLERARRQAQLQQVEAAFEPIPFDAAAARAYGRIYAAVLSIGRQPRRRIADLQIAATALAIDYPLVTRNPDGFVGLGELITVISV